MRGAADKSVLFKLEQAACKSWPALQTHQQEDWLLRYANGYTKRANSANASGYIAVLSDQQIQQVEHFYQQHNCPTVFRLASFAIDPMVDAALVRRAYRFQDMTWVMHQPLAGDRTVAGIEFLDVESWFTAFQDISGKVGADQQTHLQMLQAIPGKCAFAVAHEQGKPVCCGLGVVIDGQLGLFDIATLPEFRRQGLARRLCDGLLVWGARQGAKSSYLQVMTNNPGAISLYEQLGYRYVYHYWYRVKGF